jgi:hypothetical protein
VKDTPLAGFSYVQVLKVDVAAVAAHLTQLECAAVVASASTGQQLVTSAFLRNLGTVAATLDVEELLVLRVGASGTTKADKAMGRPNEQFVEDENRNVIVGTTKKADARLFQEIFKAGAVKGAYIRVVGVGPASVSAKIATAIELSFAAACGADQYSGNPSANVSLCGAWDPNGKYFESSAGSPAMRDAALVAVVRRGGAAAAAAADADDATVQQIDDPMLRLVVAELTVRVGGSTTIAAVALEEAARDAAVRDGVLGPQQPVTVTRLSLLGALSTVVGPGLLEHLPRLPRLEPMSAGAEAVAKLLREAAAANAKRRLFGGSPWAGHVAPAPPPDRDPDGQFDAKNPSAYDVMLEPAWSEAMDAAEARLAALQVGDGVGFRAIVDGLCDFWVKQGYDEECLTLRQALAVEELSRLAADTGQNERPTLLVNDAECAKFLQTTSVVNACDTSSEEMCVTSQYLARRDRVLFEGGGFGASGTSGSKWAAVVVVTLNCACMCQRQPSAAKKCGCLQPKDRHRQAIVRFKQLCLDAVVRCLAPSSPKGVFS